MKKTKTEKGITLIALILTIVILLILAIVAINSITNDGLLGKAENVTGAYNNSVINEQGTISEYEGFLGNYTGGGNGSGGGIIQTVTEVKNKVISTTSNTEVVDAYGNKIVVPAGFKIVVNEDTNNADTVTKGIVIEDCTEAETKGSQFVWIPVGTIYTDTAKTEANAKTITLGRYSSFTATDGVYTPAQKAEDYATATTIDSSYTEDTVSNHTTTNAIAKDIGAFVTSATQKGGYYIGRYEAGDSSNAKIEDRQDPMGSGRSVPGTLVCKRYQVPYNFVLQKDASSECKNMYSSGTFTSDLINSYAWDTAIIFIQTFGTKSNSGNYANAVGMSINYMLQITGTQILWETEEIDEQLNIYDMAGNCGEMTTESSR